MSDVRVAQELMQASKYTLENSREQKEKRRGNYISEIADIIHSLMTKNRYVRYADVRQCAPSALCTAVAHAIPLVSDMDCAVLRDAGKTR
jgi:hypothetical protein